MPSRRFVVVRIYLGACPNVKHLAQSHEAEVHPWHEVT